LFPGYGKHKDKEKEKDEVKEKEKDKHKDRDTSPPRKKIRVRESKHHRSTTVDKEPQTYIKDDEEGGKELHVTLSPVTDVIDPPEPEELIKALMVRWYISISAFVTSFGYLNNIFFSLGIGEFGL